MKVKILEIFGQEAGYDDYVNKIYTLEDITDWQEVTEEEYEALVLWVNDENAATGYYGKRTVIVTEKMLDYKTTIASYLDIAKKKKEQLLEKKRKKEKADEALVAKRAKEKEARLNKDRDKKIEKLNKLKKELNLE